MRLPVSSVDWRLQRINTKTKTPLTSQAHKSIDLKSNTRIRSRYAISLISHLLTIFSTHSVYLFIRTASQQGAGTVSSPRVFLPSSFKFYFRSCSALLLAVCFFFKTLFLAHFNIIEYPADEANRSESKSERTAELVGLRSAITSACL